jgi:MFS family permease
MTNGLGAIIGGLSVGPMVDRWGYSTAFVVLCLFSTVLLISAILVKDKKIDKKIDQKEPKITEVPNFGRAYFILLVSFFFAGVALSTALMGRSLAMSNLAFTAAALTSTNVVSGMVSLPFPLVLGWLSDRFGRKRLMVYCFLSITLALVLLAVSKEIWHFWIAAILYRIGMSDRNVGAAYVSDLVDPKALGRGVSLFQCMEWIGLTIGFAAVGNAFQAFGVTATSFISAILPVIGIILIMLIRVRKQEDVNVD